MDRNELIDRLEPFFTKASDAGKPIAQFALVEAFPGVTDTSFILHVKADWIGEFGVSKTISFLYDILFDVTDFDTRLSIFTILVFGTWKDHRFDEANAITPEQAYGELSA